MSKILTLNQTSEGNKLQGIGNFNKFHDMCVTSVVDSLHLNNELKQFIEDTYNIEVTAKASNPNDEDFRLCDLDVTYPFFIDNNLTDGPVFISTGWIEMVEVPIDDFVLPTSSTASFMQTLQNIIRGDFPNPTNALNDVNFVLSQGVGLYNTSTGFSGNFNNFSKGQGFWLNSTRSGKIHLRQRTQEEEDDGFDVTVGPIPVKSINGYENNLFSFIPKNQIDLPLNEINDAGLLPLNQYLYETCTSPDLIPIPDGTILYSNYINNEDSEFRNLSAYYSNNTWISTTNFEALEINKSYNIQFPANFSGCFRFDDPYSPDIDTPDEDTGGIG